MNWIGWYKQVKKRLRLSGWHFTVLVTTLVLTLIAGVFANGAEQGLAEIEHLLVYLRSSDCQFYRNGWWYGPEQAETHLRRKYTHYLGHADVPTAEEFIAEMATRSSVTGIAYQVRCNEVIQPSDTWFLTELYRYRTEDAAP